MKKMISAKKLIFLAIFLLPIYIFRFQVWTIPTNLWEVLVTLILFRWLWEKRNWKSAKTDLIKFRRGKKYFYPLGMILAGLFLSALFSDHPGLGLGIIKGWFFFPGLFVALIWVIFEKKDRGKIFLSFYFSATLVAMIGLGYFYLGKLTFDGRLEAFFNSPNYLAMYLAPAIIIAVLCLFDFQNEFFPPSQKEIQNSCLVGRQAKLRSVFWITSFLVIVGAYYLTYSYASWIALMISLSIVFWKKSERKKRNLVLWGFGFGLLFFSFVLAQGNSQKFQDLINFSSRSSLASRVMIWRSAIRIISDNWFFGIGPGNFQEKYLEYQKYYPPYLEWAVPHPHNIFLTFWISGGGLALGGFLWLIFLYFQDILEIKKTDALRLVSLGWMLYFLLHGMMDTTYFKNDLAVLFWMAFLAI